MGRAGKTVPPRSSGSPLKKSAKHVDNHQVKGAKLTGKQQPQSRSLEPQKWPADVLRTLQMQLAFLRQQPAAQPQSKTTGKRCHEATSEESNVIIELPVQQPSLPFPWERFLDIKTGEIYYIDWSCCKRTHRDPRELLESAEQQIKTHMEAFLEQTSATSELYTLESRNEEPRESSKCDMKKLPEDEQDADENVMVAMGCLQCLSYFMLPKLTTKCTNCHGDLLQP